MTHIARDLDSTSLFLPLGTPKRARLAGWLAPLLASALILLALLAPQSAYSAIGFRSSSQGSAPITMTITGTNNVANSPQSSIALVSPLAVNIGDLLIAQLSINDPSAIPTTPPGWILIDSAVNTLNTGAAQYIYYQMATSTSINPVFNTSNSSRLILGITPLSNSTLTSPLVIAHQTTGNSTTSTAPPVVSPAANQLLLTLFTLGYGKDAFSTPASMSNVYTIANTAGPNGVTSGAFYQGLAASGATGPRVSTTSNRADNVGVNLIINAPNFFPSRSLMLATPAGAVAGDFMVATIAASDRLLTPSAPSGWTLATSANQPTGGGGGQTLWTYSKAVASSDLNATQTWSFVGGTYGFSSGGILDFTGVDPAYPVLAASSNAPGVAAYAIATPSITPSMSGAMIVASFSNQNADGWALAGSFTQQPVDVQAPLVMNNTGLSLSMDYKPQASAAAISAASTAASTSAVDYGASSILALKPWIPPSSFSITPSAGSSSTCSSLSYTVTALSGGTTLTSYTGTIALSTSTGHGSWSKISGSGTLTIVGGSDSGKASYDYAPADAGVAVFALSDAHAETLTVSVADAFAAVASTSASATFTGNGFVVDSIDALGLDVVSGRPHALQVSLKKDGALCGVATDYNGAKALEFWYAPTGLHPGVASAPSVSASASSSACLAPISIMPAAAPSPSNLTLTFTAGVATFFLCPSDAGQYTVNVRDQTRSFADLDIAGASATAMTARPFGLWIDTIASGATANPSGTASAGAKFVPAQTAFSARVSAKNWGGVSQDTGAGTPTPGADLSGNAPTLRFAASTTLSAVALSQTPATGTLGTLSGNVIAAGSFALGAGSASSLSYNEAGSVKLRAASANYLGSGFGPSGPPTADVGRFYPSALTLASGAATPACASGSFTYMGQSFSSAATLRALGASGALLTNYDASKGYAFLLAPAWRAADSASGVDLSPRLVTGAAPAWSSGLWTYSNLATQFARAVSPDGPYDSLQLGLSGADPDGAPIAALDMSYSAAGACSGAGCDAKSVGSTIKERFGRLELANVFGSVLPTLRVSANALYWASSGGAALGWAPNTLDSCTVIPYADMALGGYMGALASASLPVGSLSLASGKGYFPITRAGGSNISGSVYLGVNLGSASASPNSCATGLPSVPGAGLAYLQSNFCSAASYVRNPNARVVWGNANGKANATIFMRELY